MANDLTNAMNTILARSAMHLSKTLLLPRFCAKDYSPDPSNPGDTINVPIYPDIDAVAVSPSATPLTSTDTTPTTAQIKIDKFYQTSFNITDKQLGEIAFAPDFLPKQIIKAVDGLGRQVSADMWQNYKSFYGFAGAAGTTPFGTDEQEGIDLGTILTNQLAPKPGRVAFIDTVAEAKARKLAAFRDASQANSDLVIREGQIGRKLGFDWYQDHDVPRHTAGTITTGLVCKAATAVSVPANQKKTQTLVMTTAASTGACALKKGDIIAINGQATGSTFVVQADATQPSASSDVSVTIYPCINTALVGSEAVTVKASHRVNLGFVPGAIQMVSRPMTLNQIDRLIAPIEVFLDPVTGLVLTMEIVRQNAQTVWVFRCLYGSGVVQPELGCRLAGA